MRRLARWIVRALPLDDRGRRAMDETFADWEHESAEPPGPLGRAASTVLALLAVARTLLLLTARETWRIPVAWALGWVVPIVVISSVALTMKTTVPVVAVSLWHNHPSLLGWMALIVAPVALPWACLVAVATTHRRRSLPLLGFTAMAVAASLVMSGWIGPDSSQHFRQSVYTILTGAPTGHELTRGLQEIRLGDLVGIAIAGEGSRSRTAANVLLLRTSLALACPLLVFLAARLRRANWWVRGLAMASFPVAFVAGATGRVDIEWAVALAFLGSLALTWRVGERSDPSAAAP